ncbi:hypothetical protein JCM14469_06640 [Desulfatiferula olefinivorans]
MSMEVDYFRMYNLSREPFSSAPDPDFFYQSRQHFGTLQQLENSIRSLAGIHLITGAPGTGKTTLLRHLYRKIIQEKNMDAHLLSARPCEQSKEFEQQILEVFGRFDTDPFVRTLHPDMRFDRLIETIEKQDKKVVILIDDGHLISAEGLHVLNRLADLERNGEKRVQIVIFANRSLMDTIGRYPDFQAKISQYNVLGPLSFADTRHMISHRLKIAGNTIRQFHLFTYPALVAIYLATGGYPKKIVKLCHRLVLSMSLRKSMKAGWFHVRFCARRVLSKGSMFPDLIVTLSVFAAVIFVVFIILNSFGEMSVTRVARDAGPTAAAVETPVPVAPPIPIETEPQAAADAGLPEPEPVVASPVTTAPSPALEPVVDTAPPSTVRTMADTLGEIRVRRGDTLLEMLEIVYGHSRSFYGEAAVSANGHLPDIHSLRIGDSIVFPIIPIPIDPPGHDCFWVRVASFSTLAEAYEFVRSRPDGAAAVKMIPMFREDTGFEVPVVLKRVFTDRTAAETAREALAGQGGGDPQVMQFSLKDSRFFSDPFFQ